jgi:hypothetical protein
MCAKRHNVLAVTGMLLLVGVVSASTNIQLFNVLRKAAEVVVTESGMVQGSHCLVGDAHFNHDGFLPADYLRRYPRVIKSEMDFAVIGRLSRICNVGSGGFFQSLADVVGFRNFPDGIVVEIAPRKPLDFIYGMYVQRWRPAAIAVLDSQLKRLTSFQGIDKSGSRGRYPSSGASYQCGFGGVGCALGSLSRSSQLLYCVISMPINSTSASSKAGSGFGVLAGSSGLRISGNNEFVGLLGGLFRAAIKHPNLNDGGSAVEQRSKGYDDAAKYEGFIVESSLFPTLPNSHIRCLVGLIGAFVSSLLLVVTIVFQAHNATRFMCHGLLAVAGMIASVIMFFWGIIG